MNTANDKLRSKFLAWQKGKHVMLTIQNPDEKQTNKRFIRVPAVKLWGYPGGSRPRTERNKVVVNK